MKKNDGLVRQQFAKLFFAYAKMTTSYVHGIVNYARMNKLPKSSVLRLSNATIVERVGSMNANLAKLLDYVESLDFTNLSVMNCVILNAYIRQTVASAREVEKTWEMEYTLPSYNFVMSAIENMSDRMDYPADILKGGE